MAGKHKTPDPVDIHVGAQVKHFRKLCGLSQTALGDAVGVSFQQIQKYEKGANRIGASRLKQIASVLRVQVSSLLEEENAQPSSDQDELNAAFERILDPDMRKKTLEMVEAIANSAALGRKV